MVVVVDLYKDVPRYNRRFICEPSGVGLKNLARMKGCIMLYNNVHDEGRYNRSPVKMLLNCGSVTKPF